MIPMSRPSALLAAALLGLCTAPAHEMLGRERLIVLTDISNEPDDEQSMVRLLVYANEFELEGLIATTSTWLRNGPREDLIHRQLDAYARVRDALARHAKGFPTADELRAVTATGQAGYGLADVGHGRASAGSELLRAAAARSDPRPLWVALWGGANTLAQSLTDARRELAPDEFARLVSRLRVYSISDQDDAGAWLRREFPTLFYIASPSTQDWKEYWRATWTGISGDRHYRNGPGHAFELVDNPWLERHVMRDHGALGGLYPKVAYIMEGDTPSFLGLIENGLGWAISPAYGGWGGRYVVYQPSGESRPFWTNNHDSRDTVTADNGRTDTSDPATIWRWRTAFQHDFAARMDWCSAKSYREANHRPTAVLNGDTTQRVLEHAAASGETVSLSSAGSSDPDGHALARRWFVYREAGTYPGEVVVEAKGETARLIAPAKATGIAGPQTIHIILEVTDDGSPSVTAYRRLVVTLR